MHNRRESKRRMPPNVHAACARSAMSIHSEMCERERPATRSTLRSRNGESTAAGLCSDRHQRVLLNCMDRLVQGAGRPKPDIAIEAHGRLVPGGHFEIGLTQAGNTKAVQRLQQQKTAQTAAAMVRDHAKILD